MQIRQANPDEWSKVVDIYRREKLDKEIPLVERKAQEEFLQINSARVIWFAEQDNQVVGVIQLIFNGHALANGVDSAMIHHLRVAIDFQGQGIGSMLIKTAEQEAAKRNITHLYLEVERDNQKAQVIYTHLGYSAQGPAEDTDEVVLLKLFDKPSVIYTNRSMTDEEFAQMNRGFDKLSLKNNNPVEESERFGFVAQDNDRFIGCVSGLAYKGDGKYNAYFFLTDLFVEEEYRHQGIGSKLLQQLEAEITQLGIKYIWTWTAGYEGKEFYEKQGYSIFTEMKQWYESGHSRFGFIKTLSADT